MKTMKIMKRLMGCAAAILALTACSESEDLLAAYHSDSKAVHITAQVGKASADGFTRSNPLGATAEEQAKFNAMRSERICTSIHLPCFDMNVL